MIVRIFTENRTFIQSALGKILLRNMYISRILTIKISGNTRSFDTESSDVTPYPAKMESVPVYHLFSGSCQFFHTVP